MAVAIDFAGFVAEDFDVFALEGFEQRMRALREHLRPRLVVLADALAPGLSRLAGTTLYPHVAAHLRRTVNPPPETWAAFGPDPRRYKAFAHYALGVAEHGVWLRLVLKDEALADRQALGRHLAIQPRAALADLPADMEVVSAAGVRPVRGRPDENEVARLSRRSDAQWAVGVSLSRDDAGLGSRAGVEALAAETLTALLPLWHRLPSWPRSA
jgi:uncharacterized protein YktB (UPF0637 family)